MDHVATIYSIITLELQPHTINKPMSHDSNTIKVSEKDDNNKADNNHIISIPNASFSFTCINRVKPYLYISDFEAATSVEVLVRLNIKLIITVSLRNHSKNTMNLLNFHQINVKYFRIEDDEKTQLLQIANKIHKLIEKTRIHNPSSCDKNCILIHCDLGMSRSASCVIYLLMKSWKLSYHEAYVYLKSIREHIDPNEGFRQQLLQYDNNRKKVQITSLANNQANINNIDGVPINDDIANCNNSNNNNNTDNNNTHNKDAQQ